MRYKDYERELKQFIPQYFTNHGRVIDFEDELLGFLHVVDGNNGDRFFTDSFTAENNLKELFEKDSDSLPKDFRFPAIDVDVDWIGTETMVRYAIVNELIDLFQECYNIRRKEQENVGFCHRCINALERGEDLPGVVYYSWSGLARYLPYPAIEMADLYTVCYDFAHIKHNSNADVSKVYIDPPFDVCEVQKEFKESKEPIKMLTSMIEAFHRNADKKFADVIHINDLN